MSAAKKFTATIEPVQLRELMNVGAFAPAFFFAHEEDDKR